MRGKRWLFMLCTALLLSAAGPGGWSTPAPVLAHERDVADVSVFDEPLARYGTWTTVEEHGRVWRPNGVPRDWRPYTDGRWVYSDVGWTWVSDHPWGWAPFHYGRWSHHVSHGWYWVPDRVWGPAWVSWRRSPGWVGWAPLPPRVRFDASIGLGAAHIGVDIAPNWFAFVPDRHILAPRIRTYMAPPVRNVQLVRVTRNVTNYTVINNRIVNRSIDVKEIERVTRRPVVVHRIVDDDDEKARGPRVRDKEREVVIGRPAAARERRDNDNDQGRRERQEQEQARERRDERGERPQTRENLARERAALAEQHRQEQQHRPEGVTAEELRQRHKAEREALESKARRQRQDAQQQQAPAPGREEQPGTARERHRRERQKVQQETARERQRQQQPREEPGATTPSPSPEQREGASRERPAQQRDMSPEERRERRQQPQQEEEQNPQAVPPARSGQ